MPNFVTYSNPQYDCITFWKKNKIQKNKFKKKR